MKIKLVTDEKIAETSSKGNQEKWFDKESGFWYKLDQFGYEALSETLISNLLERSNIETSTPFSFVRYTMDKVNVHGRERVSCVSKNFLKKGQEIITLNKLLSSNAGKPLRHILKELKSDKKRIEYIGEQTAEITGLKDFGKYLSVLFETDAVFLNTDRHLNNIAVLYNDGKYDYCPIFDNGAGLLSDTVTARTDIEPKAFIDTALSFPFGISFTRQVGATQRMYGKILELPIFTETKIKAELNPLLEYYPERDRAIISDRVVATIVGMQKKLKK